MAKVYDMKDGLLGRRERKKIEVRERIIEETKGLLDLYGVDGVTIDAISDCTDVSKKTFYNYYSSKHDLLVDICRSELLNRTEDLISFAVSECDNLAGQLELIFTAIMERNLNAGNLERSLIDYLVRSLSEHRDDGVSHLTAMNDAFQKLFSERVSEIKPELPPKFCAEMTVGMLNAVVLNWLNSEDYDSETEFKNLLKYIKSSMLI